MIYTYLEDLRKNYAIYYILYRITGKYKIYEQFILGNTDLRPLMIEKMNLEFDEIEKYEKFGYHYEIPTYKIRRRLIQRYNNLT